ncbi:MAG: hypothetical protein V4726_22985 [Verrucomicrobiota bacterium]
MKFPKLTLSLAVMASFSASSAVMAASDAELCSPVTAKVTKAVAADAGAVLKIVAEQVAASPKCACEIVSAAITASKADKATVVSIVEAAAAAAPAELPVVLACAASASPEAAAELANKFSKETEGSGKGVVGKEPVGKGPIVTAATEEDATDDFGLIRPGVGGIYLTIPTGNGSGNGPDGNSGYGNDGDGDGIIDGDLDGDGDRDVTIIRIPGNVSPAGRTLLKNLAKELEAKGVDVDLREDD